MNNDPGIERMNNKAVEIIHYIFSLSSSFSNLVQEFDYKVLRTIEQTDLPVDLGVFVVVVLDGRVVVDDEGLLDELEGHRGLAHAPVAHDHDLCAWNKNLLEFEVWNLTRARFPGFEFWIYSYGMIGLAKVSVSV